jgi:hypothetical protein
MAKPIKAYERVKEAHSSGGYAFNDPAAIEEQRGIVWEVLKQVASSVTKSNLISISLPVRLFEPRSYLERITDAWCFAPVFLTKAAETSDPLERLKLVVTFALSGLHQTCKQKKPFNPILGETFEGRFPDGTQVYCEQTAHHPPITAWEVYGPRDLYKFYGYGEWTASFSVNSVSGAQKGIHIIDFPDGSNIKYVLPEIVLKGVLWGERIMEYVGTIFFRDAKNKICARLSIPIPSESSFLSSWWSGAATPPSDYLRGEIYRYEVNDRDGSEIKGQVLSTIAGTWLGCIEFDEKPYWSISSGLVAAAVAPVADPLPSDSRFREDLRALKDGKLEGAAEWKTKLEEKQRRDKKLRQNGKHGSQH